MSLSRLVWSFGLRRGLALWLLPELEKERVRRMGETSAAPFSGQVTTWTQRTYPPGLAPGATE